VTSSNVATFGVGVVQVYHFNLGDIRFDFSNRCSFYTR